MTPRELWHRLKTWSQRDRLEKEVQYELDAHVELLSRDLERDGLSRADALAAARRQVGHTSSQRESSRDAWGFPAIDVVLQDVRYAIRGLRRTPLFTATAVVTLGLGIGANAAMFAVLDELMFRPMPYLADAAATGRIYLQTSNRQGRRSASITMPYTRYVDLTAASRSFSHFAAISEWRLAVGVGVETRVRKVAGVSASMWRLFDARPVQGRFFGPADDRLPAGNNVAVLTHSYWRNAFGGRDVLGERLRIGILDFEVIGVAPEGFIGATSGMPVDIFVPVTTIPVAMTVDADSRDNFHRDYRWDWVEVLARRRPGVSSAAATAELTEAYRRSRAKARAINRNVLPDSIARPEALAGPIRTMAGPQPGMEARVLLWVTGVAAIVLLIACANVANLMLSRVLRRRQEIAVRLALGVSRGRLAAQFIVEGLTLTLLGAASGMLVAQWTSAGIRALMLPQAEPFNVATDARTITAAFAVAVIAALLTVLGPMAMTLKSDFATTIRSGPRGGGHRSWLRASLLVAQGGLSVALLVGAALFVRSLDNVMSIPLGFDATTVVDVFSDFRGDEPDSAGQAALRRRMLAAAQALPEVESATRINSPLFRTNTTYLRVPGVDSVDNLGRFAFQFITPDFFKVMRTRILRGREFDGRDAEGSARAVIVSASMARVLWPNKDALGQCIQIGFGPSAPTGTAPCTTVVGIAEDMARTGIIDTARYAYYLPVDQVDPAAAPTIYARLATKDLDAGMERLRRAMQAEMPGNGFVVVTPVQKRVDDQRRGWRLGATFFLAFGLLALIVAAVGLYGVTGYNVAQRTHEMGVRVALGARKLDIVGMVVRDAMFVSVAGVSIGFTIALAGSRWLQPLLYEQSARDPLTYGAIGLVMIGVAIAAAAIPALRASRVDPNLALRSD